MEWKGLAMVSATVTEITRHERDRPRMLPAIGSPERGEDYAHMAVAPGNAPTTPVAVSSPPTLL